MGGGGEGLTGEGPEAERAALIARPAAELVAPKRRRSKKLPRELADTFTMEEWLNMTADQQHEAREERKKQPRAPRTGPGRQCGSRGVKPPKRWLEVEGNTEEKWATMQEEEKETARNEVQQAADRRKANKWASSGKRPALDLGNNERGAGAGAKRARKLKAEVQQSAAQVQHFADHQMLHIQEQAEALNANRLSKAPGGFSATTVVLQKLVVPAEKVLPQGGRPRKPLQGSAQDVVWRVSGLGQDEGVELIKSFIRASWALQNEDVPHLEILWSFGKAERDQLKNQRRSRSSHTIQEVTNDFVGDPSWRPLVPE